MAGGGGVQESSSGKKSVDAQLNLIPFIDLLSVLIAFLLMTSVWTQIERINVNQQPNLPSEEPPEEPEEEQLKLTVLIKSTGYTVTTKGKIVKEIEKKGDEWDPDTLNETLKNVVAENPSNHDVTLNTEDTVPYEQLITVMDLCLEHKLEGISVSGVSG